MKTIVNFLMIGLLSLNFVSAQTTANSQDELLRASFAAKDLVPVFQTPYGKACGEILLDAHLNLLPYPDLPTENMPKEDKANYLSLYEKLSALRKNPPSWDEIVRNKAQKVATEFMPPTAPVFVGDAKVDPDTAEKYKHLNRHYSKVAGKPVEQTISE